MCSGYSDNQQPSDITSNSSTTDSFITTDILIIGAGAAGLSAACEAKKHLLLSDESSASGEFPSSGAGAVSSSSRGLIPQAQATGSKCQKVDPAACACGIKPRDDGRSMRDDILILEARDRPGGRIDTQQLSTANGSIAVDLGANWIHGIENNPLHQLTKEHQIATVETDYQNLDFVQIRNQKPHQRLSYQQQPEIIRQAFRELDQLFLQLEAFYDRHQLAHISVWEALQILRSQAKVLNRQIAALVEHLIYFCIEVEVAASLKQQSLLAWIDGDDYNGPDVIFSDGYRTVIDVMLAQLTDVSIAYSQPVSEIDMLSHAPQVRVQTTTGQQYLANSVIVTLPLGVLQSDQVRFTPPLPASQQEAIASLTMGQANKLVVSFDHQFWDNEPHFFASRIEDESIAPWLRKLFLLNRARDTGEAVLVVDTDLDPHNILNELSEDDLRQQLKQVLGLSFQVQGFDIVDLKRSNWQQDPYSCGCYSRLNFSGSVVAREKLATPVDNKLFFAGEATDSLYPGTVHGAYLSGARAAALVAAAEPTCSA